MRKRWALVAAGLATLFAVATAILLRPTPSLGSNVDVPADVWIAVDTKTGLPDRDAAPRVSWPAGQDLSAAGFACAWGDSTAAGPALRVDWDADIVDRLRARFGVGRALGIDGVHVAYAATAELRADSAGASRRYATSQTEICTAPRLMNASPVIGRPAPGPPLTLRASGGIVMTKK